MIPLIGAAVQGVGMLAKGVANLFSGKNKAAKKAAKEAKKEAKELEKKVKYQSQEAEAKAEGAKAKMQMLAGWFAKNWWYFAIAIGVVLIYKFFFQRHSPSRAQAWSRRMHAAKRRKRTPYRRRKR